MAANIYKGSDLIIQITVKKNGAAKDLSGYNGLIAVLYNGDSMKKLEQYSRDEVEGYEDLEVVDEANGVVKINLKRSVTKHAETGPLYIEIKAQEEDVDFDDSAFQTVGDPVLVGNVVDALTKNSGVI